MEMAALSLKQGEQQRVREERREAYFAVLRLAYINSYRQKYERRGDEVHLRQVEERWPRSERLRMVVEADIALEVYGSQGAREAVAEWTALDDPHDGDAYERFYERFLNICRRDLGAASATPEPRPDSPSTPAP
jgi:hypothetical protein